MKYCVLESVEKYICMNQQMKEDKMRGIASCCVLGMNDLHSCKYTHGLVDDVRI